VNAPPALEGSATKHPWVMVLVEATTSWGEGIVRGVVNFARVNHRPLAAQLMGLGVPTVNVSWFDWEPAMTTVTPTKSASAGWRPSTPPVAWRWPTA